MSILHASFLAPIAMALAIARQPPRSQWSSPPVHVPHPVAPSPLPDAFHVDDANDDDALAPDVATRTPCTARRHDHGGAPGAAAPDARIENRRTIDWCAVPPFEPRYAPQIPAEWWWRRVPWRAWRPW